MNSSHARQFEMSIDIDASPEIVWHAIANDVELRRWFAPKASVTPGEGGSVSWTWEEHHDWPQTIEIWEPGQRLKTRYDSLAADGQGGKLPLFMDFQLDGRGGKTTLRLVHSGFGPQADFDNEYDGISRGWPVELRSLKLYAEKHFGQDRQLAWCARTYDGSPRDAWEKLTGPDGLNCGVNVDQSEIGAPFEFTTADADHFAGTALQCHEQEFTGMVASHDDGFFRVSVHDMPGMRTIWLWLATYGNDPQQNADLASRWEAMLTRLFPQTSAKESVAS